MAKWDLTATAFPVSASLQAYRRREPGNGVGASDMLLVPRGRGRGASWHDDYRWARAFAVKPVAPQRRRSPWRALRLDRSARPKRSGLHAINAEKRLGSRLELAAVVRRPKVQRLMR
jgi:hypothetical protein